MWTRLHIARATSGWADCLPHYLDFLDKELEVGPEEETLVFYKLFHQPFKIGYLSFLNEIRGMVASFSRGTF